MDYAAAGIFLNITGGEEGGSAPWWEQPGLQMAPGLEAMSQVRPRYSHMCPQPRFYALSLHEEIPVRHI